MIDDTMIDFTTACNKLFSIRNARRVVAVFGAKYRVCSRSAARRLGGKIVARNY